MANMSKILALADFIEARTDMQFNMAFHQTCIIGFAETLFQQELSKVRWSSGDAAFVLDLTDRERNAICFCVLDGRHIEENYITTVTRDQAVKMLRNFASTGVVDWRL